MDTTAMLKARAACSRVICPVLMPASPKPTTPTISRRLGSTTSERISSAARVSGLLIRANSSVGMNSSPFWAKNALPPGWTTDLNRLFWAPIRSASSARASVASSRVGASTTARM